MILDTLQNFPLYGSLGSRFQRGLEALSTFGAGSAEGRSDLLPANELYALVQRYDTKPPSEKKFESHRRYADIQFMIAGEELMYWSPISTLEVTMPYNAEKDAALYGMCAPVAQLHVRSGMFAIFFPEDGHVPGVAVSAPAKVHKVVLKVLLD